VPETGAAAGSRAASRVGCLAGRLVAVAVREAGASLQNTLVLDRDRDN
jgi:hypothetical protein